MQIAWYGRDGKGGRDIGKDHSILTVQLAAMLPAVPADVKNGIKGRDYQPARSLKLLPGVNDNVSPKDWEDAKKTDLVKHYVATGHLEAVEAETLTKMKPEAARALIVETIDLKLLAKWRAAEPVGSDNAKAIDEHMAKLKAPIEPPAKK